MSTGPDYEAEKIVIDPQYKHLDLKSVMFRPLAEDFLFQIHK